MGELKSALLRLVRVYVYVPAVSWENWPIVVFRQLLPNMCTGISEAHCCIMMPSSFRKASDFRDPDGRRFGLT